MTLSIPAFHVSDTSEIKGNGKVSIVSRVDTATSITGTFDLDIGVGFPAASAYPAGHFTLQVSLTDGLNGLYRSTFIDLINSYGRVNPTVFITGRCDLVEPAPGTKARPLGLSFWLIVAQNKAPQVPKGQEGTPDVVGFAIHDHTGARVAYGTGPVLDPGSFVVMPKP